MFLKTFYIFFVLFLSVSSFPKISDDKKKCPKVKAIKNLDLEEMLGAWYVIQYYASSEEALLYRCMKSEFTMSQLEITMNFTYSFIDDPLNEELFGNITWTIPNTNQPAHWIHSEDTYEGVYNTYVMDSEYKTWALLLHCAEKSKSPRYLSSFIMSRHKTLGINVVTYLRDKLPKYGIDLSYMFDMDQINCDLQTSSNIPLVKVANSTYIKRHPLKH